MLEDSSVSSSGGVGELEEKRHGDGRASAVFLFHSSRVDACVEKELRKVTLGASMSFTFPMLTDESLVSSKALFRTLNKDSSARGPFLWRTSGLPPVPSHPLDQNTQLQARTPVGTRVSSEQSPHDSHLHSVSLEEPTIDGDEYARPAAGDI